MLGMHQQSAEDILAKLMKDVKELADRRESTDVTVNERAAYLEKLQSWESTGDRILTEQDVYERQAIYICSIMQPDYIFYSSMSLSISLSFYLTINIYILFYLG